jgi:hypothetical protein
MSDHTTGPPNAIAEEADNDLAVGRVVDIISHSSVWKDSAIFVEEDDAQDGVDHVDGHRSAGLCHQPLRHAAGERRWHWRRGKGRKHLLHASQHDPHD